MLTPCFEGVCKSCVTVPVSKRSREQPVIYLHDVLQPSKYRKIPKISHGAYMFQRPFLRGLSMEGNLRFKIDWASLTVGSKFTVFSLFYFVFEGNFQLQPPGALIFGGAI